MMVGYGGWHAATPFDPSRRGCPVVLTAGGLHSALGSGGGAAVPHALVHNLPKALQRDRSKLRVAHFVTMTGTAGIWGPSSVNCAVLAASEINARGGILGRELELTIVDTGAAIECGSSKFGRPRVKVTPELAVSRHRPEGYGQAGVSSRLRRAAFRPRA